MMELSVEDPRWDDDGLVEVVKAALTAGQRDLGFDPETVELSVVLTGDARIAELNSAFRDKASATNVLSWPAQERGADEPGGQPRPLEPDPFGELALGDIAISYETCAREADAAAKPMAQHVAHLALHGLLHLLGYDHETDADAALMEGLEVELLEKQGLPDPYST